MEKKNTLNTSHPYPAMIQSDIELSAHRTFSGQPAEYTNPEDDNLSVTPAYGVVVGNTLQYDKDVPIHELINIKAQEVPQKTALVFEDVRISYRELNERSNQMAAWLIGRGVRSQDVVGLAIDRTEQTLICLLAIMKTGATYLPVDLEFPADRINFIINDAQSKFILTEKKYSGRFDSSREIFLEDAHEDMTVLSTEASFVNTKGSDIAYILYTSGSTGNPKGARITHRNLLNFILGMQKTPGISPNDCLLAITTIAFDIAALELYLPLVCGATVVLVGRRAAKDGYKLLDMIKDEGVTMIQATPSTWRMLLESGWDYPLPVVALIGGESLPANLAASLIPLCKELWNMYGPTETTVWSTAAHITDSNDISIGTPVINTQVYILADGQDRVADGKVGEIYIGGDGVTAGYLNRHELTKQRFLDDPFSGTHGAKMYKTGDLGKIAPSGKLMCLGRADNQVKLRGYRIELEEIEHCIVKINGIKEAIATVYEDNLLAYVTIQPNADITRWREQLKDKLPAYMVPFDLIIIDKFTLTPNGKIDRKALPRPQLKKAISSNYIAPRSEAEYFLAAMWEDLLKLPQVGVTDDFFELGGHSLIGIQVMSRIYRHTGKKLPLATLFDARTVEQIALMIGTMSPVRGKNDCLVEIKPGGNKAPLYIVHGLGLNVLAFTGLAANMDSDQPVYGLQAIGLDGISEPPESMEEIARCYVDEILEKHGGSTVALAGYSFGGTIAFEMAKQLTALGKKVTLLAMFDAYNESGMRMRSTHLRLTKKLTRQLPKMAFIAQTLVHYPYDSLRYQYWTLSNRFKEMLNLQASHPLTEVHANAHHILAKYESAYNSYNPGRYDGAIHVFRVKKRLYYLDDLKTLGWSEYARDGVTEHEIPGDHHTFLKSPYDKIFAKTLQQQLDKTQLTTTG